MKKEVNIALLIVAVISVLLLFWPFAAWNGGMALVLRIIPSAAVQALFCRIGRSRVIKVLPAVISGIFAAWGTYLYCTSPHWANATVWDLIADYVSPCICCVAVLAVGLMVKRKAS